MIKFVLNKPALLIEKEKILVIADLHLGLEYELYKSGIAIPSQLPRFREDIVRLLRKTKVKKLVILGDLKHKVPGISKREERIISSLIEELKTKVKIYLTLGNHDTSLKSLLSGIKIFSSRGFVIKNYGFFHGHAWPSKQLINCDYLFMGHIHPQIQFKDEIGYSTTQPVWVKCKLNKEKIKEKYKVKKVGKLNLFVLPAFNPLVGGISLNKKIKEELSGPLFSEKFLDLTTAEIYLLDGTFLSGKWW